MSNILTPPFRVSYPNVFKAKMNDLSKKEEFSLVALFKPGEDLSKIKEAIMKEIVDTWGADKNKWPEGLKTPFKDQASAAKKNDKGEKIMPSGYTAGAIMVNLKSFQRPGLINQQKAEIIDPTEFYAGCWAHATIVAKAYNMKVNKGVSLWVQNIQKLRDDEPLSGRARPEDEFSALDQGPAAATAPSQGTSADFFS